MTEHTHRWHFEGQQDYREHSISEWHCRRCGERKKVTTGIEPKTAEGAN